jgi:hypothetical protein
MKNKTVRIIVSLLSGFLLAVCALMLFALLVGLMVMLVVDFGIFGIIADVITLVMTGFFAKSIYATTTKEL